MNTAKYNLEYATTLIQTLVELGAKTACIAPGSRSTPLTLAAARNPHLETRTHFDERALAFYALGRAKVKNSPVIIITTSGTAVANLLPAVVEAHQTQTPLILLTADRPKELIGTGANQTINQTHIFSSYAKFLEGKISLKELPNGPLHINCPFEEPLYEENLSGPVSSPSLPWRQESRPSPPKLTQPQKETLKTQLKAAIHPIIVLGETQGSQEKLTQLEIPIFPDILSDLRHQNAAPTVPFYDLLLSKSPPKIKPDLVIHIGDRPTSKALQNWLSTPNPVPVIHITETQKRVDLTPNIQERIHTSVSDITEVLLEFSHPKLTQKWTHESQKMQVHIESWNDQTPHLSELYIAHTIAKFTPDTHNLMISNSLPIRLMDLSAPTQKTAPKRYANRGASGIDGILATTLGVAEETQKPTTLLIGDLAFLYDLNALLMFKNSKFPITIVLINNKGGAIFSTLSIKNDPSFDPFFKTPQECDPSKIAAAMDIPAQKISQKSDLIPIFKDAIASGKHSLIECETHSVAKDLKDIRQ